MNKLSNKIVIIINPQYSDYSTPGRPDFVLNKSFVDYNAKINGILFVGDWVTIKTSVEEIKKEILDQLLKDYKL